MVSSICLNYSIEKVLLAATLTCFITVGLTIYSILTKTDFTIMGGILVVLGFGFLGLLFVGIFLKNSFYHKIVSFLGVILFGFYLVYDT